MIFVECLALGRHGLVASPRFRDQHHDRMGHGVAAAHQEFQRVVEAGRIRLTFIGDRPELGNIVAEEFGRDRSLARRHPVDVAAQRVDFAVMGNHAVWVGELPGREGVGGEALVNERHRTFEARIGEVLVIGADLIGQEHALVDDRRGRERHRIEILRFLAAAGIIDAVRQNLADQEQTAFEFGIGRSFATRADEDLHVMRFGRGNVRRLGERGIVHRHVAEAEKLLALFSDHIDDDLLIMLDALRIAREEDMTDGIFAGFRQRHTLLCHFLAEEAVGDLHKDARAITHQRVGTDGAAMRQVLKDEETVLDDLVRLLALHMRDEADAAGIVLVARIVKTLPGRKTANRGARRDRLRRVGRTVIRLKCQGLKSLGVFAFQPYGHFHPSCKLVAWCHAERRRPIRPQSSKPNPSPHFNLGQQCCLNSV